MIANRTDTNDTNDISIINLGNKHLTPKLLSLTRYRQLLTKSNSIILNTIINESPTSPTSPT